MNMPYPWELSLCLFGKHLSPWVIQKEKKMFLTRHGQQNRLWSFVKMLEHVLPAVKGTWGQLGKFEGSHEVGEL